MQDSVPGEIPVRQPERRRDVEPLHPAWRDFIRYCRDLRHGEIERLCIQDGLPMLAEVTRKKIKFK